VLWQASASCAAPLPLALPAPHSALYQGMASAVPQSSANYWASAPVLFICQVRLVLVLTKNVRAELRIP